MLGVVVAAAMGARAEDEATPPPDGAALYAIYCSSCHGADGRGRTPLAELLREAPPDLATIASRRGGWFPEDLVREIIDGRFVGHGERDMPVWGRTLTRAELDAITDHLHSLQDQALTQAHE